MCCLVWILPYLRTVCSGVNRSSAVQEHASKFFHVWPRLATVLRWLVVLFLLLVAGTYLIRETYHSHTGTALDWVDSWCAPRLHRVWTVSGSAC